MAVPPACLRRQLGFMHPEMLATSRKPGAQPPPPPPESDPDQEYDERHMGIPRPASNDADQPLERLESASFPARAETNPTHAPLDAVYNILT